MVTFGKFAGEVWDQVFSAAASRNRDSGETVVVLDARIKHWQESILPTMPLLPISGVPSRTQLRQRSLVRTVHVAAPFW
jgi:hypothetical protein